MKIGLIGLGRMGQSIAARLLAGGFDVIGYDKFPPQVLDVVYNPDGSSISKRGVWKAVDTLEEVARHAHVFWLMVPAGSPVDDVLHELVPLLEGKRIIIDGGNSFFKDSLRRSHALRERGHCFLDCGTSGGLQGRTVGFCLMIGGEQQAYEQCIPFFKALAAPEGYAYVGPSGAGHYVKMIHNGIEYALLEAYAEGFHLLKDGFYDNLDLSQISNLWNHGSIIRSWILELAHQIFIEDLHLENITGSIQESGTGKWTVEEAHQKGVPVPIIEEALRIRAWSRQTGGNYATKLVALLRQAFGGHALVFKEKREGNDT